MQTVILYGVPADPEAFDRHYKEVHTPLVLAMPHLLAFSTSRGPIAAFGGGPYHLAATMRFTDHAAMTASQQSAQGLAAAADVPNFASGGMTALVMQVEDLL